MLPFLGTTFSSPVSSTLLEGGVLSVDEVSTSDKILDLI
jgi:hypothetical protein